MTYTCTRCILTEHLTDPAAGCRLTVFDGATVPTHCPYDEAEYDHQAEQAVKIKPEWMK